jgi:(E)-4-hydroxy-3-methylbut-2-enyl-diphosphate synthase
MTTTKTRDVEATCAQIRVLEKAGCEIVRLGVPEMEDARVLGRIRERSNIPIVADIHFSADLALESLRQGVDKLRINPGNLDQSDKLKQLAQEADRRRIPIRIGVNAGSLGPEIMARHGGQATPEAMVESAEEHIQALNSFDFDNIAVSLKASDIDRTVRAYRLLAERYDYPLHIGVTEAGSVFRGTIMSSIGIGILLYEGLGDTIRVSLTGDPKEEARVGWEILKSLGLRQRGPIVTSCPTCARTEIDLVALAGKVENAVKDMKDPIRIAVMGCVVNGPGEAQEADIGVIGGRQCGLITRKGDIVKKVPEGGLWQAFLEELKYYT